MSRKEIQVITGRRVQLLREDRSMLAKVISWLPPVALGVVFLYDIFWWLNR